MSAMKIDTSNKLTYQASYRMLSDVTVQVTVIDRRVELTIRDADGEPVAPLMNGDEADEVASMLRTAGRLATYPQGA
jgi:hypothetical protein